MLDVYVASLIRSFIALHSLIGNKLTIRDAEKKESMAYNMHSCEEERLPNVSDLLIFTLLD
jgi:hypothetical protein